MSLREVDYLVVGGGFYGCCLALFLRSISDRVLVVEAGDQLMERASRVNQARIHTGFHYPRSALTAVKSMVLHRRFMNDFPEAVVDDFQMLYAIARKRSKVSAKRFFRMFRDIGAPIRPALPSQEALFDSKTVEGVFACAEAAFDCLALRQLIVERLNRAGVEVRMQTALEALDDRPDSACATLADGSEVSARYAFNVTYAKINDVLDRAQLPQAQLKHELAEVALVEPPDELRAIGVTVMDGPFFSCMPYPSEGLYSLTHVRYTPHGSWTDERASSSFHDRLASARQQSAVQYMIHDGQQYLPCLAQAMPRRSLYEVKTVLTKNERDDGRPILYQQKPAGSRVVSILGGKIDNIYELFELITGTAAEFSSASTRFVLGDSA
jgi:glycine/D-amino acid oxidase-like deaminating enzyme